MAQYNIEKIDKKLRKEMDSFRYRHTLGVMYTSAALAMRYDADLEQAQVAGLLHDCAKGIPNDKKIRMCRKYNLPVSGTEIDAPYLLHAKLGAYLAKEKYGIEDEAILSAITWHTTGRPAMTELDKIVFIADYIEPMRNKAENLELVRKLAFSDLDMAVYVTLRDTLKFLDGKDRNQVVDQQTELAFRYYETLIADRKEPEYE